MTTTYLGMPIARNAAPVPVWVYMLPNSAPNSVKLAQAIAIVESPAGFTTQERKLAGIYLEEMRRTLAERPLKEIDSRDRL